MKRRLSRCEVVLFFIRRNRFDWPGEYLLVALRQKILSIPAACARKILNVADLNQANRILREAMIQLLNELKDLPSKVTDPHWLRELEKADDGKLKEGRRGEG